MKKFAILFSGLALILASCGPGQTLGPTSTPLPTNTPMPTSTPLPTDTPIPTSSPTPTNTPVPTSTDTPTPTIYPLSSEAVLAEIVLQEEDLKEFFQQVGIETDGFADGSQMGITKTNSYDLLTFTHWSAPLPPGIVSSYSTIYTTERVFSKRLPTFIAFHNTAIFVFPSAEDAHTFFISDTQSIDPELIKNMPTIGDESVAFSGRIKATTRPIGGVIWRYREVYVLVSAQLNFQVMPESLTNIAQNIQGRLAEAMAGD